MIFVHEHPRANVVIRSPFDSFELLVIMDVAEPKDSPLPLGLRNSFPPKKNLAKFLWGCQGTLYYKTARNSTKCLIHKF